MVDAVFSNVDDAKGKHTVIEVSKCSVPRRHLLNLLRNDQCLCPIQVLFDHAALIAIAVVRSLPLQ